MARMDFHTHSFFSDGALLPEEMARRLEALGHKAFALTDHAGPSNLKDTIFKTMEASRYVNESFSLEMIVGVELTHVLPQDIPMLAKKAKKLGAQIVIVHGETLVEPVKEETNMAACLCTDVDILAHPGILSVEEAKIAQKNDVFVELTTRQGHCLGNGNTSRACSPQMLLVNTDAHAPQDFASEEFALRVAMGSGLSKKEARMVCEKNTMAFLEKVR